MGAGSFSASVYRDYSINASVKSRDEIFTSRDLNQYLDPKGVVLRESRDSVDNPESTAIIVALDVTGSMGMIAEAFIKSKLGELMLGILESKPVTDPHLMFMGIGDMMCDRSPLQVSQFEADNRIVNQLEKMFLEGGGGGNDTESYDLPWYFAANYTDIDCFNKRGVKGYLFTIGDECAPIGFTKERISRVMGNTYNSQPSTEPEEMLKAAQEKYHCFHLIIEQGNYCVSGFRKEKVVDSWRNLLNRRAILVDNYQNIADIVLAIMQVNEGVDVETILNNAKNRSIKESIHHALFD